MIFVIVSVRVLDLRPLGWEKLESNCREPGAFAAMFQSVPQFLIHARFLQSYIYAGRGTGRRFTWKDWRCGLCRYISISLHSLFEGVPCQGFMRMGQHRAGTVVASLSASLQLLNECAVVELIHGSASFLVVDDVWNFIQSSQREEKTCPPFQRIRWPRVMKRL